MTDRFLNTLRKYDMLTQGDRVLVGVSGGADSLALLMIFIENRVPLGIGGLFACHFNHGLRGAESDADERLVREFCAAHAIELAVGQGRMNETQRPKGESVESFARTLRYRFFSETAQAFGADKVAVAHNKNDVVETALFNLARGTGLRGVRGIPPVRANIIRPLIETGRQEIENYCRARGIAYATDSTNAREDYARNRIRLSVIPALEAVNSAAVDHIARFCRQAAALDDYMEEQTRRLLESAAVGEGYHAAALLDAGEVAARYAMKSLIDRTCGGSVANERLVALCLELLRTGGAVHLDGGHRARVADGVVSIEKVADHVTPADFCQPLREGENSFLAGIIVKAERLSRVEIDQIVNCSKLSLNYFIDCDKIKGEIFLRSRREGDRLTSRRRGVTKSLKKLFQESGVPAARRAEIPVLSDEAGILWVMGEGPSRRAAVGEKTVGAYYITVETGEMPCTVMY